MTFILSIAGFFILFMLFIYGAAVVRVMNITSTLPDRQMCKESDIPTDIRSTFVDAAQLLLAEGFQFDHCQKLTMSISGHEHSLWAMIYLNKESKIYAHLCQPFQPNPNQPYDLELSSHFSDEGYIYTLNCKAHQLPMVEIEGMIFKDHYVPDSNKQIELHQQDVITLDKEAIIYSPEEFIAQSNTAGLKYIDQLNKKGWIKLHEHGYNCKFIPAIKLVFQVNRGLHRVKKLAKKSNYQAKSEQHSLITNQGDCVNPWVEAYYIREKVSSSPLKSNTKWLIFLLSAVLFSLSFGLQISFETAFIFLGVIFFHELGHILGMFMFGFKNLQILFIPFMGAVATGHKKQIRPYQHAIIYLLGPVPGELLGCFLILYGTEFLPQSWALKFIVPLFIINYLNLLPLLPLDGGQLLNAVLFDRHPKLQIVFLGLSGVVIGVAAWKFTDPVLTVIGILVGFNIYTEIQKARILMKVTARTNFDSPVAERENISTLFAVMNDAPYHHWHFDKKYVIAKALSSRMGSLKASLPEVLICLSVYLAVLILPVYYFVGDSLPNLLRQHNDEQIWEEPNWEKLLSEATTDEEKLLIFENAYDSYSNLDNEDLLCDYTHQALVILNQKGVKDARYAETLLHAAELRCDGAAQQVDRDPLRVEPLYIEAIAILRTAAEDEWEGYANALESYARFLSWQKDDNVAAIKVYAEAVDIFYQQDSMPNAVGSLIAEAKLYQAIGDSSTAEKLHLQAIEWSKKAKSSSGSNLPYAHQALADHYMNQPDYIAAEKTYFSTLEILDQSKRAGVDQYRSAIHQDLFWLYLFTRDYGKAQKYLEMTDDRKTKNLLSMLRGPSAEFLKMNLILFYAKGDYATAEDFYKQYDKKVAKKNCDCVANTIKRLSKAITANENKPHSYFAEKAKYELKALQHFEKPVLPEKVSDADKKSSAL